MAATTLSVTGCFCFGVLLDSNNFQYAPFYGTKVMKPRDCGISLLVSYEICR